MIKAEGVCPHGERFREKKEKEKREVRREQARYLFKQRVYLLEEYFAPLIDSLEDEVQRERFFKLREQLIIAMEFYLDYPEEVPDSFQAVKTFGAGVYHFANYAYKSIEERFDPKLQTLREEIKKEVEAREKADWDSIEVFYPREGVCVVRFDRGEKRCFRFVDLEGEALAEEGILVQSFFNVRNAKSGILSVKQQEGDDWQYVTVTGEVMEDR